MFYFMGMERLTMTTLHTREEELRKEFQDFADGIIWSNDDGSEKYIGVGNMADWWISRINSIRQEIIEKAIKEVEGMKLKKSEKCSNCGGKGQTVKCIGGSDWNYKNGYNQALSDIITYLESEKDSK